MKWVLLILPLLLFSQAAAVSSDLEISKKIEELKIKSNAHSKFVRELLADDNLAEATIHQKNNSLKVEPSVEDKSPENLPVVTFPSQEVETFEDSGARVGEIAVQQESNDDQKLEASIETNMDKPAISSSNSSSPTYEELYEPKVPQRRVGYYFGPFLGPVFPDNGSVKQSDGSRIPFSSDNGFVGGFRLGNDFGSARIEGEYAFISHGIDSNAGSGRTNFHNLNSRLILEKSLGEQADFRGGIGLGVGFANHELNGLEYDGVGFSYDFLLGWSYRVMNNWSINLDYRHYLTAAHENYDRLQGHIIEIAAVFDL